MKLSDFELVDRGHEPFDVWEQPQLIGSSIGDFKVQLQVEMNVAPTDQMLTAAKRLVAKFNVDKAILAQRVHDRYLTLSNDVGLKDWLIECSVPHGLKVNDLSHYLRARTLTVFMDLNMVVFMIPKWDEEHCLLFDLEDDEWIDR